MTNTELLNATLRGTETDWEKAHEVCIDRARTETLGRKLEESASLGYGTAKAWAQVLAKIHPELRVTLRPAPSA